MIYCFVRIDVRLYLHLSHATRRLIMLHTAGINTMKLTTEYRTIDMISG
jgi:hypothetical protein